MAITCILFFVALLCVWERTCVPGMSAGGGIGRFAPAASLRCPMVSALFLF